MTAGGATDIPRCRLRASLVEPVIDLDPFVESEEIQSDDGVVVDMVSEDNQELMIDPGDDVHDDNLSVDEDDTENDEIEWD